MFMLLLFYPVFGEVRVVPCCFYPGLWRGYVLLSFLPRYLARFVLYPAVFTPVFGEVRVAAVFTHVFGDVRVAAVFTPVFGEVRVAAVFTPVFG